MKYKKNRPWNLGTYLLFSMLCSSLILLSTGCDPAETEPAYLQLNGLDLQTVTGEGAATHAITEVWVFVGDNFLGVYQPDARVPLLESGETPLRFEFGVKENGISATPNIYDFYAPINQNLVLTPGQTEEVGPFTVRYKDDINFAFIEDFEPGSIRVFTDVLEGTTTVEPTTAVVRSGAASGLVTLTPESPGLEVATIQVFNDLVGPIGQVWLEVDFLSDIPAVWGILGTLPGGNDLLRFYDPGFSPRPEWTKIYFNLTPLIVNSRLEQYSFGLTTFINDLSSESGTLYLDNIKVLYF